MSHLLLGSDLQLTLHFVYEQQKKFINLFIDLERVTVKHSTIPVGEWNACNSEDAGCQGVAMHIAKIIMVRMAFHSAMLP
jgi:hypothetical protein